MLWCFVTHQTVLFRANKLSRKKNQIACCFQIPISPYLWCGQQIIQKKPLITRLFFIIDLSHMGVLVVKAHMRGSRTFCQRESNSDGFFDGGRGSKIAQKAFRMQADDGPTFNAGLEALWFFRGSGPVLLRKPIFL